MSDDATPIPSAPPPELVAAADGLVRERLRFGIPITVVGLGFYLVVAATAGFTGVLHGELGGGMSATLLLLMLLIPLVWVLTLLYRRRADRWDARAEQIRAEFAEDLR
ncbi:MULTISPECIES: DUF485 domain-containing protein [unclassified Pseudonocardia]|uniref:DUF485 domain-containing protein n=1 Tax=unclassified Pseudonocardia TaxID=2619320 RepID=UPI0001FFE707|nr:DUF485 domain-containing protein [Pseudonocardia sp. Ae707_Ps1]OLM18242.1 hypothetical protein Ae707Ps1_2501 [Pseudonocardia sp. Ae707_Ps1]